MFHSERAVSYIRTFQKWYDVPFPALFSAGHPGILLRSESDARFCCKFLPASSTKCSLALLLPQQNNFVKGMIQNESQTNKWTNEPATQGELPGWAHRHLTSATGHSAHTPPPGAPSFPLLTARHSWSGLPRFSRSKPQNGCHVLPWFTPACGATALGGVHSPFKVNNHLVNLSLPSLAESFPQTFCGSPLDTERTLEWLPCWKV